MYWFGLRGLRTHKGVSRWFLDILNGLKPSDPGTVFQPGDFLSLSYLQRNCDCEKLRISTHAACGERHSHSKKDDPGYKNDHLELFRNHGMRWPVDFRVVETRSHIIYSGLMPRECELVVFLDKVWEPQHDFEFIDVNANSTRIVSKYLKDGNGPKLDDDETPWRVETPPTLVGSQTLVVRHRLHPSEMEQFAPKTHCLRLLESFELFRLQGWSDSYWNTSSVIADTHEQLERLSNITGNGYSFAHYLPWTLALLSTFGRYCALDGEEIVAADTNAGNANARDDCLDVGQDSLPGSP